jgi:predicted permease
MITASPMSSFVNLMISVLSRGFSPSPANTAPVAANVASAGDLPERYRGALITPNTLRLLRVKPVFGRDFTDADSQPGAPAVAIISYNTWVGRFERAESVLGKILRINGEPVTIVGVMPARFGFPQTHDLWQPLRISLPDKRGDGRSLDVMGRLKPGVTVSAARADMQVLAAQLARQYPENEKFSAEVEPYVRRFIGAQPVATLSTMLGAVFGVLLIACVNVTNLQLARAAERMKEIAVRVALGATRRRIIQQLLVEGLLLSAGGAALGLGIAAFGMWWFNGAIADTNPPFWIVARIDVRVVGFVTALTVMAAIASSLMPALRVSGQSVNDVLKDEGRSSTGLRVGAFSRTLVVVEMTLSFVLLVVSGLMIKSVVAKTTVAYPFATDVLVARSNLNEKDYADDAQLRQRTDELRARIAAAPGIRGVAIADGVPDGGGTYRLTIEGQPAPANDSARPLVRRVDVSPEFFDVLHIRVRDGRAFSQSDGPDGLRVGVASEDFVRKFFPKGGALGKRIQIGTQPKGGPDGDWITIVGTVPSVAVAPQPGDTTEMVFLPLAQHVSRDLTIFADAGANATLGGPAVRKAVMEVDPNLPVFNINTLQGQYDQNNWPFRVFGGLFMTFGMASLLMAGAGLYGVMSFAVRRRTQEIGVRMALGASRAGIIAMVVKQGVWQVALGMAVGAGIAGWLGGLLKLLLFQVQPWDLTVFACTIGVLSSAGLLACVVPARRAASVDPLVALRHD